MGFAAWIGVLALMAEHSSDLAFNLVLFGGLIMGFINACILVSEGR